MNIKNSKHASCTECKGYGGTNIKNCNDCNGTGHVTRTVQIGPGMFSKTQSPCQKCKQTGKIIGTPCNKCKGNKTTII